MNSPAPPPSNCTPDNPIHNLSVAYPDLGQIGFTFVASR
jgi:hypothetical protein